MLVISKVSQRNVYLRSQFPVTTGSCDGQDPERWKQVTAAECAVSLVYHSTPESEVVLHCLWMKQLVVTQVKVRFVETAEFL